MTGLSVSVTVRDGAGGPCTVIQLVGEADATTLAISETFAAEVAKKPQLLVVDLSGLSFIDSWALSVIMRTHRALRHQGGRLVLASPSPSVARALQLIDIARTIPVFPSLGEATAAQR